MLKSFKKNYAIIIFITVIMLLAVSVEVLGRTYNINDRLNDKMALTEESVKEELIAEGIKYYRNIFPMLIQENMFTRFQSNSDQYQYNLEEYFNEYIDYFSVSEKYYKTYISDRLEESGKLTDVLAAIEEAKSRIIADIEVEILGEAENSVNYVEGEINYYKGLIETEINGIFNNGRGELMDILEDDLYDLVTDYVEYLITKGLLDFKDNFNFENIAGLDEAIQEGILEFEEYADGLYDNLLDDFSNAIETDIYEKIDEIIDEIDI